MLSVCLCVMQNVKSSDKISATEHCNCTVAHVEHPLARFAWARLAHEKQLQLREDGIPVPRTASEVIHSELIGVLILLLH